MFDPMSAPHRTRGGRAVRSALSPSRTTVLIVADADADMRIIKPLFGYEVDVRFIANYGGMAEALFDECEQRTPDQPILFIVDLRISCGAAVIEARLRDYDAALNAYLISGRPWPKTLCMVEVEQTRPLWLRARPHLRATLLADEVETVVGHPHQLDWQEALATAVRRCLTD